MTRHAAVIFLDVDGVLVPWEASDLDRACVQRCNRLVEESGARVVLSSSWRESMALQRVAEALDEAATFPLSDELPVLLECTRGEEVAAWRRANGPDTPFVIVDDGADVRPYASRTVRPDADIGLQDADVDEALTLLCKP